MRFTDYVAVEDFKQLRDLLSN